MSDYLEACRTGSRFGFNDFNGLDRERFGGQVGSLRYYFQCVVVFEGAPFSKSQAVSKHDVNRGTGLWAVVLGGMQTFAAICSEVCYADFPDIGVWACC